jgi:hypothetical protein
MRETIFLSDADRCSGATLVFSKKAWEQTPFRSIPRNVDSAFMLDQMAAGCRFRPIYLGEDFIQLRHSRPHLWNNLPWGQSVQDYLSICDVYSTEPRNIFPVWVLARYERLLSLGSLPV